jgi:hypothetical protein
LPDVAEYEAVCTLRQLDTREFTKKEQALINEYASISDEEIASKIAEGHDYHFVGRVGQFCPIKPGCGGGELLREATDAKGNIKYASATGAKGYRWLESEMVKTLNKEDDIDRSYYNNLVDGAVSAISEYGDFEWFVSDNSVEDCPYVGNPEGYLEDISSPWSMPCGQERKSCIGCPKFHNDAYHSECDLGHDISNIILKEIK